MAMISVLLATSDAEYSHRLQRYISENHRDIKLTILDSAQTLNRIISDTLYDVVLIGEEFSASRPQLPAGTACGWLSARDTGGAVDGNKVYCKYRSGETLYQIILELYSEVSGVHKGGSSGTPIYAFTSTSGGAGATLVSAALAVRMATARKNVLYVSFDRYCKPSLLFDGEIRACMSDFIFSVLSSEKRNIDLGIKAASMLTRDSSGARYMEGCKNAADMDELSEGLLKKAFDGLKGSDEYDAIICDIPLSDKNAWEAVGDTAKVFAVTEPGVIQTQKLERFLNDIKIKDTRNGTELIGRCAVIINKNVSREQGIADIGGVPARYVPKYKDNDLRALINAVSRLQMWDDIV